MTDGPAGGGTAQAPRAKTPMQSAGLAMRDIDQSSVDPDYLELYTIAPSLWCIRRQIPLIHVNANGGALRHFH
jgi:hypothetical protein